MAKGKYSDKMKTLKTKMKKVKEEQKDLETNLIKFNAFVKEKQLKVRERPLMMSDFKGGWGRSDLTPKNRTLGGMGGQKSSSSCNIG